MSALRQSEFFMDYGEYLILENMANFRHEYYQGEMRAMPGTAPTHNTISMSVACFLANQLLRRPCRVFKSAQRLHIAEADLSTYPDVMVACLPHSYAKHDSIALIDATVIIEILSPSTARWDKGGKFEAYKNLPSLRHYVLIETETARVAHWRLEDSEWREETFTELENAVNLSAVDCRLTLGEIYERVEFED